jgi:ABC-type amino acid transport substrate-binding protein
LFSLKEASGTAGGFFLCSLKIFVVAAECARLRRCHCLDTWQDDPQGDGMTAAPDLLAAFTPTGVLRAAINLGNPILAGTDPATGEPRGVSVDLARAFAQRLGVDIELVAFDAAGQSVQAVTDGQADIGFFAAIRCAAPASPSPRPTC